MFNLIFNHIALNKVWWGQNINGEKPEGVLSFVGLTVPWAGHGTQNWGQSPGRGREETCGQVPLLWFQRERTYEAGQTDLDLADLSNVSRLGGMGAVTTAWHLTLGQLEQLYIGPRVWELIMEVNWLLEKQKWPASSQCLKLGQESV